MQPDSARAALQIFAQGKGDVLITYENEAIYAEKKGVHTQYKTPKATLLIETPVALTRAGLKKPAAKAFYKYLWSATAQKAFAAQGYRPVVKSVAKGYTFYKPAGLFTINTPKLGLNGWAKVNRRFFHPQKGIVAKIEKVAWPADTAVLRSPAGAATSRAGGGALGRGIAMSYLSVIVLLPLAACAEGVAPTGSTTSGTQVDQPQALAALKLTFGSPCVAIVNMVFGTAIAWVLVRDDSRARGLVNSVIDLPFALPTIVAGMTLLALYGPTARSGSRRLHARLDRVALLFVTLPFVVRAVQPVLIELDREMEEAAASLGASRFTIFRRIILPNLRPAILAGAGWRSRGRSASSARWS